MDLEDWSTRLKVFADATRVLLALLEQEELTVAELSAITRLAQPRVSTHLARLKEAGLVRDRRAGVSAYYRFDEAQLDPAQRALWHALSNGSDDPLLRQDAERVAAVLAHRASDQNWADSVAGDMERHYSPGRTWRPWRAPRCHCWKPATCWTSPPVTACWPNWSPRMPSATSASIPARAWSPPPASACAACPMWKCAKATCTRCRSGQQLRPGGADARVDLRQQAGAGGDRSRARAAPGGRLLLCSLARHEHKAAVEAYGHVNLGFSDKELRRFVDKAGLQVSSLETVTREKRPPHFEVISLIANKP